MNDYADKIAQKVMAKTPDTDLLFHDSLLAALARAAREGYALGYGAATGATDPYPFTSRHVDGNVINRASKPYEPREGWVNGYEPRPDYPKPQR